MSERTRSPLPPADLVAQLDDVIRSAQQLCETAGKLNGTPAPAGLTELWQLREKLARI
jgi:hypothetical protein